MVGRVMNYFAGGNTSQGFYNLFDSNLANLERLFILKGGPGTGKSYLIKKIGKVWLRRGYSLEYMHCSSDKDSVDGMIIRELNVGIVDGTNPHALEPKYPGVIDDYVNMSEACQRERLLESKNEIISLTNQVRIAFQSAYDAFHEAQTFHNKQRQRTAEMRSDERLQQWTEKLVTTLFQNKPKRATSTVKHRFHGANTPTGPYSFLNELVAPLEKRYVLNGRVGTGTSIILKRLLLEAEIRGLDLEVYHCGFEPEQIDLLIIRELGVAIVVNKKPYELRDIRQTDEVLNVEELVFDTVQYEEDRVLKQAYEEKMSEGLSSLAKAKALRDQLEHHYQRALDFSKTTSIRQRIMREIEAIASGQ